MLASARDSQPLPPAMCMLYLATARCRLAVGPGTRWSAQGGRLFGGQQAAGPELGGERGAAQGSPRRGGDAVVVGALARTRHWAGASAAAGGVRRAEQPGGPVGPALEGVRAG